MSPDHHNVTARVQLERLGRLTDVVYGVALVIIITWLPLPEESLREGGVWLYDLWFDHTDNLVAVLIGVVFVILYWIRSNSLLSALDRTDGVHTGFSIASVFFLLMLLYIVRVSPEVVPTSRRAGESAAVALTGITAGLAWWRARKKGLVREDVDEKEGTRLQLEAFTEPLTALITFPMAYLGDLAWNASWLLIIPIGAILKRRKSTNS